jgi:hypothetical protein
MTPNVSAPRHTVNSQSIHSRFTPGAKAHAHKASVPARKSITKPLFCCIFMMQAQPPFGPANLPIHAASHTPLS